MFSVALMLTRLSSPLLLCSQSAVSPTMACALRTTVSVSVFNSIRMGSADGAPGNITGRVTPDASDIPDHLTVQLISGSPFPAPYWVNSAGPIIKRQVRNNM